jgi:hypothetical protein
MNAADKRNKFEEEIFYYQKGKDDKVFIYWYNKQVMILRNKMALKFIKQIEGLDDRDKQLVMAKITGNFKRGNERKKGNR